MTASLTLAQMECKCPQAFEFMSSKSFQGVEGRYTCTYRVLRWWNSSNLNVLVLNHSYDDEGVFGINIHHAGIKDAAEYNLLLTKYTDMVEKYSAGCQVIATIDDFKHFMELVKLSIMKTKKPYFTYTLFQGNKTWNNINAPLQMALLEKTNSKKRNLVTST